MEITLFNGARDTAPVNIKLTWPALCEFARELMTVERHRSDKLNHHAMMFGRCEGRRAKVNVRFLSGLAADFDLGPDDPRYVSFDTMCDRLSSDGFAFIAYTTTANDAGHNRYRLLMPYPHDVPFGLCQPAWRACNAKFDSTIDASTKDESRLSFLPARWTANPFNDAAKGLVTLRQPLNAIRVNVIGKPILSAADIASLSAAEPATAPRRCSTRNAAPTALSASERRSLAHDKADTDAAWMLLANLNLSPLVQRWMVEELPSEEGNRDYRFMFAVASQAIRANIPITAEVIALLAEQFSRDRLHREPPHDVERQAENALSWALRSSA